MSKTAAFIYSCLIYFSLIFIIFLCSIYFKKNIINYGNDVVDILFVEDYDKKNDVKQDFTKEIDKNIQDSIVEEVKNEQEQDKKDEIIKEDIENNIDDLFSDLQVVKEKKVEKQKTQNQKNKNTKENKKATTIKSNSNSKETKTSAKVSGIYDPYFGRVNAYLKNLWSLVVSNQSGIDDKEFFEVSFTISKDGIIKIDDSKFLENTILRKNARIFIDMVNNQNKNLGIPPNQKEYNGTLRLSVILNIKEFK